MLHLLTFQYNFWLQASQNWFMEAPRKDLHVHIEAIQQIIFDASAQTSRSAKKMKVNHHDVIEIMFTFHLTTKQQCTLHCITVQKHHLRKDFSFQLSYVVTMVRYNMASILVKSLLEMLINLLKDLYFLVLVASF